MTDIPNQPSPTPSPQGRRVLVAVVTGAAGVRIQRWREAHDPVQARRLPPHATLCYWVPPDVAPGPLGRQVAHAFATPVTVELGAVRQFEGGERTFYVELKDTAGLDEARRRLYDGTHVALPGASDWTWHVTCVRDARGRDEAALREAARALTLRLPWRIDSVALLELRGERYEPLATWSV